MREMTCLDPCGPVGRGLIGTVGPQHLFHLGVDSQQRVQGTRCVLEDHPHMASAETTQTVPAVSQDLLALEVDGSAGDMHVSFGETQQASHRGGLSASRLPDQPDHISGIDIQIEFVHRHDSSHRTGGLHPQGSDAEQGIHQITCRSACEGRIGPAGRRPAG